MSESVFYFSFAAAKQCVLLYISSSSPYTTAPILMFQGQSLDGWLPLHGVWLCVLSFPPTVVIILRCFTGKAMQKFSHYIILTTVASVGLLKMHLVRPLNRPDPFELTPCLLPLTSRVADWHLCEVKQQHNILLWLFSPWHIWKQSALTCQVNSTDAFNAR